MKPSTEIEESLITKLLEEASAIKEQAYNPYSKIHVGAAILTKDDKIFTGCNIENASYSGTICAERVAIFKAVSEGITEFKAIAVAVSTPILIPVCGICLQVLTEFCDDIPIFIKNNDGSDALVTSIDKALKYRVKRTMIQ